MQKVTLLNQKRLSIHLFGYENYSETKCAVGKFEFNNTGLETTFWIDAKKGTCLKTSNIGSDSMGNKFEYVDEYVATYDIVNDDDVQKPDLTGYTLIQDDVYEE